MIIEYSNIMYKNIICTVRVQMYREELRETENDLNTKDEQITSKEDES